VHNAQPAQQHTRSLQALSIVNLQVAVKTLNRLTNLHTKKAQHTTDSQLFIAILITSFFNHSFIIIIIITPCVS